MVHYVVTGLVKRRAELIGEIEATHLKLRKMIADLKTLHGAILQFAPDHQIDSIKPKTFRPPSDRANRGEMSQLTLNILRLAS